MKSKLPSIKRHSYSGLPKKYANTSRYILVVASRTVSHRLKGDCRDVLNLDYQDILAPSEKLLNDWNRKRLTPEAYTKRFVREQSHNGGHEALEELKALSVETGKQIILLCHCAKSKFCHTNLLVQSVQVENDRTTQATWDKSRRSWEMDERPNPSALEAETQSTKGGLGVVTSVIRQGSGKRGPLGKGSKWVTTKDGRRVRQTKCRVERDNRRR